MLVIFEQTNFIFLVRRNTNKFVNKYKNNVNHIDLNVNQFAYF